MSEEMKVSKDYKEAFNLGYEMAKELKLKSPMFQDTKAESSHLDAMQAGMMQFHEEILKQNSLKENKQNSNYKNFNKGFGKDLSL